jgi:hypothetical protein
MATFVTARTKQMKPMIRSQKLPLTARMTPVIRMAAMIQYTMIAKNILIAGEPNGGASKSKRAWPAVFRLNFQIPPTAGLDVITFVDTLK